MHSLANFGSNFMANKLMEKVDKAPTIKTKAGEFTRHTVLNKRRNMFN